jgi:hypothetical protein
MHRDLAGRQRPSPQDARRWRVHGNPGTCFPGKDNRIEELSILTLRDGVAVLSEPAEPFSTMWIIPLASIACIEPMPSGPDE